MKYFHSSTFKDKSLRLISVGRLFKYRDQVRTWIKKNLGPKLIEKRAKNYLLSAFGKL